MKLILEAIKSLFRGVNGRIQQTATALGKRIDYVQADAKRAMHTAKNAQTKANAAQTAAELAAIPICQATSTDGKYYDVALDESLIRHGQLLVIVPDKENLDESISLRFNGDRDYKCTYQVGLFTQVGPATFNDLPEKYFLYPGRPVVVMLCVEYNGSKLAFILGFIAPQ